MPNDDDIWSRYASGVKKIRKAKTSPRTVKSPSRLREGLGAGGELVTPRASARLLTSPPSVPPASGREALTITTNTNLDRRAERDMRRGEIALEARIDLHGMTQAVAYEALAHFIAAHAKAGRRNLLIITGKGKGNAGVLKTNLPLWLQTLPEAAQIMALRPAAPKHGGDGAFYLLLRKKGAKVKH